MRNRNRPIKKSRLQLESLEQRQLLAADAAIGTVDDVFLAIHEQNPHGDLNEDDQIDLLDARFLVENVMGTRWGDLNLDGRVSFADFLNLSQKFGSVDATFADGDTDGDGIVSFSDFLTLSSNFNFANNEQVISLRDGATRVPTRAVFDQLAHFENVPGTLGIPEVKFVIDLSTGQAALANHHRFSLHYPFASEVLGYTGNPVQFNSQAYFADNRRFVVGSILAHDNFEEDFGETSLYTVEFWPTDPIKANHVIYAMDRITESLPFVSGNLAYHPSSETQREQYQRDQFLYDAANARVITTEELFGNQTFAALNPGVAYGRLRVVDGGDGVPLTARDIVIFRSIPNDLTHVAGVITVQPQTPLSHVNLRAKQNDTPNAFVRDALTDPAFQALVGKNVRFEVINDTYTIREATAAEVDLHLEQIRPTEVQLPARDLTRTEVVSLESLRTSDQIAFGAKAANLGELALILPDGQVPKGLAVPFALYDQFMKDNGFYQVVENMLATTSFRNEPEEREAQLKQLRSQIKNGVVSDAIRVKLDAAYSELRATFGDNAAFRARSSTNNEDLVGFTGAGLYRSYTHRPDEGKLENTIRQVWSSLWTFRAFEEREFWRIDHFQAAMGVAIHPNFDNELANGVAVTKNIYDPGWEGYYVNVQVGEDLVTNPEGNAVPEEFLVSSLVAGDWQLELETQYIRYSNLTPDGVLVMSQTHIDELVASMRIIQRHFKQVYEAQFESGFAMDIEFKVDAQGQLVIKQARPWVD